jgi:heptosyltransferase-2
LKTIKPEEIKKILVRIPNWIGDAVLAIPALTAIRSFYKTSEITLLGLDPILQLLRENRIADHAIIIERKDRTLIGKWALIQELKKANFDLAILLQNAFEAAFIAFLSGIPNRYGYDRDGRRFLLSHPIPPPRSEKIHQLDYYLNLVGSIKGMEPLWRIPTLYLTEDEKETAQQVLKQNGISNNDLIIGINAGAAYGSAKRWLPERFAQMGDRLIKEKKAKVIFFGSRGERRMIEQIVESMDGKPVNLTGKTEIRELMGLIFHCDLFVTNDSGPMHIASALDIPLISIFGSTDSITTSPVGLQNLIVRKEIECSPCLLRECPIDHRCMSSISVDDVMEAVHHKLAFLEERPAPAVFLDRDGTLNEDTHYVSSEKKFHLFPETPEAIALFNQMELPVFIITNQSGISRGYFSEGFLLDLHLRLKDKLSHLSAEISGIYYCPHHPDAECSCRKPKTGLIEQILQKQRIDLKNSYVVGDKLADLEMAYRAGAKGVLVLTGKGKETLTKLTGFSHEIAPVHVAKNVLEAARWIKKDLSHQKIEKIMEKAT